MIKIRHCIICGKNFKLKTSQIICKKKICKEQREKNLRIIRWWENREEKLAEHREDYLEHRDKRLAYQRKYSKKNKGRISACARERYKKLKKK